VIKEEIKVSEEHGIGEFVMSAWWRAIDAREDNRMTRE
jgi:hypothetical protein